MLTAVDGLFRWVPEISKVRHRLGNEASLYNSQRRLLVDFGFLWLHEHSKSSEDVREADSRELSWAVGDGQTQHHALGHLRIRMGAAQSIGRGNVGTT